MGFGQSPCSPMQFNRTYIEQRTPPALAVGVCQDGILGWIEDIKKDIIYCKEKGWKCANFIEDHTKEKDGADFTCNKVMRKFHWE